MAKEKKYNPVQAQRKADKAKEIKKGMRQLVPCKRPTFLINYLYRQSRRCGQA